MLRRNDPIPPACPGCRETGVFSQSHCEGPELRSLPSYPRLPHGIGSLSCPSVWAITAPPQSIEHAISSLLLPRRHEQHFKDQPEAPAKASEWGLLRPELSSCTVSLPLCRFCILCFRKTSIKHAHAQNNLHLY